MTTVHKLNDVLPKELQEAAARPLEDYFNKPLVIHTAREVTGAHGPYMRLVVSETPEGEQFYLSTGASQVHEILSYLKENKLFPVSGQFKQVGKAIILVE